MNALDVLRSVIGATGFRVAAAEAALADLDALVRAAERTREADNPLLAEFPQTARGMEAEREILAALEAQHAALARVKGET